MSKVNKTETEHDSIVNQKKIKETLDKPIKKDTLANVTNTLVTVLKNKNDSTNYIGFVNKFYFSDSHEVYLELYFKSEISNYKKFDSITKLATEVIYSDDENTRYKLSQNHASSNFDLRGLSQLHFFDSINNPIGQTAYLKNYEFLEQNISPVFIATYKTEIDPDKIAYCISGKKPKFRPLEIKKTIKPKIIYVIEEFLELNEYSTLYTLNHIQYIINSKTLTFSNTDDYSFIHLSDKNNKSVLLFKDTDYSNITDVKIIPIIKNEMPVLLCSFMRPESDMLWDSVLIFQDGKYKFSNNQRI